MPEPLSLVSAAINLLVSLIFGIIVQANIQTSLRRGTFAPLILVATLVCACLSFVFAVSTVFALIPASVHASGSPVLIGLYGVSDIVTFVAVALFAHLVQLLSVREEGPSRRWLIVNYSIAATVVLGAIPLQGIVHELPRFQAAGEALKWSYVLVVTTLSAVRLGRVASREEWRPGLMGTASRSDFWALAFASVGVGVMVALHLTGSWAEHRPVLSLIGSVLGLAIAAPFVARNLGIVLSGLLSAIGLLSAVGLAVYAGIWLGDELPVDLRLLAPLATILLTLLALGPGQPALLAVIERIVFRRSRLRREELAHFLRSLSPDLGPGECTVRAIEELRRVLHLRGVALVFRDGGALGVGDLDAEAVAREWPKGAAADGLLDRPRFGDDQTGLPRRVREILNDRDILGIVAVRGSNRLWGHLLLRTDLIATVYRDEGTVTAEIFADQLAVLLDAASLLDRAVEMERTLAHSEKLAAMGELSARVVHDIRNPITAARSLAQQLASEPGADEAHGIIVEELERVESHVAELLRFSRRDELDRQPVDLASLVQETVARLRGRLESADIQVSISGPGVLVISADREKLRHVLINLIENAADALSDNGPHRRIAVALESSKDRSRLRVSDNGPGIPEVALQQIFEPFVSSKSEGTGLGLAIVKRTIEAHGGHIAVASNDGDGVSFVVDLPTGEAAKGSA